MTANQRLASRPICLPRVKQRISPIRSAVGQANIAPHAIAESMRLMAHPPDPARLGRLPQKRAPSGFICDWLPGRERNARETLTRVPQTAFARGSRWRASSAISANRQGSGATRGSSSSRWLHKYMVISVHLTSHGTGPGDMRPEAAQAGRDERIRWEAPIQPHRGQEAGEQLEAQ